MVFFPTLAELSFLKQVTKSFLKMFLIVLTKLVNILQELAESESKAYAKPQRER